MTTPTRPPMLSPQEMEKLSRFMFNMSHNEKYRAQVAEAAKEIDPSFTGAFKDVFLEQKFNAFAKKFEDERLSERMQKAQNARESQKAEVIKKRGFNDDQVKGVEQVMTHYGLPDWEAAADIYAQRNPPDDPSMKPPPELLDQGSTWEFPTVPGADGKMLSFADFAKNPRKSSKDAAIQVITEFKRNRLPGAFHARG
jgi:hypothetical protein